MLLCRLFPLKMNRTVYNGCVGPAIIYGCVFVEKEIGVMRVERSCRDILCLNYVW